ncbi:MAG TPA: hypothetical protein VHN15_10815 [Thermoanaerobaculia bacterium]|nr:hypothetical protein [Thermoanaerobaculia bacterium]
MNRAALLTLGLTGLAGLTLLGGAAVPPAQAASPRQLPAQTQASFQRAADQACAVQIPDGGCGVTQVTRRVLIGQIAEYSFQVRVGTGPHDVIGVHRVVREVRPNVPARTTKSVMLAHGDAWGFDAAFLASAASPSVPDARALPIFLARNGMDVWGIDFRWALVPAGTTNFAFMEDWDTETDARDLGVALGIARISRRLTGSPLGKMHLLGWSRGAITGYAYLNAETQLPLWLRQVSGFIPVDIFLKTDVEELREAACERYLALEANLEQGVYHNETGVLFSTLGTLAKTDPTGISPVLAGSGLTNLQAALLVGAATFQFANPVPFYHFVGGTFDAQGVPTGLRYTDVPAWLDFISGASPYQPNRLVADTEAAICDDPAIADVSFDDRLDRIRVPVLYVGAGGGFGQYGVYTTTLLGSRDVTSHVVSVVPADQRLFDLGHADIFHARDAQTRFWQPILSWLQAH